MNSSSPGSTARSVWNMITRGASWMYSQFGSAEDEHEVILLLGYGMLYNHSYEANCEYVQDGPRVITFVTTRDVDPGEELTIDYGEEWWSTRNLEPDP